MSGRGQLDWVRGHFCVIRESGGAFLVRLNVGGLCDASRFSVVVSHLLSDCEMFVCVLGDVCKSSCPFLPDKALYMRLCVRCQGCTSVTVFPRSLGYDFFGDNCFVCGTLLHGLVSLGLQSAGLSLSLSIVKPFLHSPPSCFLSLVLKSLALPFLFLASFEMMTS